MFISWMLIMPSFKKSLIVEQFLGNYLKDVHATSLSPCKSHATSARVHVRNASFLFPLEARLITAEKGQAIGKRLYSRLRYRYLLWASSSVGSKPIKLCTFISYQRHFAQIRQTFFDLFSQKSKIFTLKFKRSTKCNDVKRGNFALHVTTLLDNVVASLVTAYT